MDEPAVGKDHVGGGDRVARESVPTAEPAQSTTQCVAGHADVGGCARQEGEAVLARGKGQRLRQDARLDPGPVRGRVHLDAAHPLGLEEDRRVVPGDRTGVMTTGVEGDRQTVLVGQPDRRDDIVHNLGQDDGDRSLVHGEVPRCASRVPAPVIWNDDIAADPLAERTDAKSPLDIRGARDHGVAWLLQEVAEVLWSQVPPHRADSRRRASPVTRAKMDRP